MNDRNHIVVAKKYQRVVKRNSTNNLHHLSSLQQSSSRGRLSDHGSQEGKNEKKRVCKRSRYQWVGVIREEVLRKNALTRSYGEIGIKDIIGILESAKWVPTESHHNLEELLEAEEVIKVLKKHHKCKFTIDEVLSIVGSINLEVRPLSLFRQKHNSCSQIIHQIDNDPQTARFKDNTNPNSHQSSSINLISHSNRNSISYSNLNLTGFQTHPSTSSDYQHKQNENSNQQTDETTLFWKLIKDSCDDLEALKSKAGFGHLEKNLINQLLNYSIYRKSSQMFIGVKLVDLRSSSQVVKLLGTPEYMQFLGFIEALRVLKSQFSHFQYLICPNLKIVNLSDNNLSHINYLSQCQQLQFLNVNSNQLKSLNPIRTHKHLRQIHCLNNFIQTPLSSHKLQKLQLLDLGFNQIIDLKAIECFSSIPSLYLLNLMGNPLLTAKESSKKQLGSMFKSLKNFQYPDVYGLSEFSIFKDITFFTDEEKRDRENEEARYRHTY